LCYIQFEKKTTFKNEIKARVKSVFINFLIVLNFEILLFDGDVDGDIDVIYNCLCPVICFCPENTYQ